MMSKNQLPNTTKISEKLDDSALTQIALFYISIHFMFTLYHFQISNKLSFFLGYSNPNAIP